MLRYQSFLVRISIFYCWWMSEYFNFMTIATVLKLLIIELLWRIWLQTASLRLNGLAIIITNSKIFTLSHRSHLISVSYWSFTSPAFNWFSSFEKRLWLLITKRHLLGSNECLGRLLVLILCLSYVLLKFIFSKTCINIILLVRCVLINIWLTLRSNIIVQMQNFITSFIWFLFLNISLLLN